MKVLVLSHFDSYKGPSIYLKAPVSFESANLEKVASLMDLQQSIVFLHEFEDFISVNLAFEIENRQSRGNLEALMISILLFDEEPKVNILKEFLHHFVEDFKKIRKVETIFHTKQEDPVLSEVKLFFESFYKSLPKETVFTKERTANIFIFGLDNAGKTTIINRLKQNIFTNPIPTTNINIVRLLFDNLSLTAYDAAGQQIYRKIWETHLKNQDGLVFILDISDGKRFPEATSELLRISNMPQVKSLPLLILFNKVDKKKIPLETLIQSIELKKIQNNKRKIKTFYTSAKNNEGIDEAFNWLAIQILNKILFQ